MADSGQNPPITVIVPVFNGAEHLPELLAWMEDESRQSAFEAVFSDNGSTDGTIPLLEEFASRHPFVTVTRSSRVRNAAHARNTGARAARGDILLFLDADDVPGNGWVDAMASALQKHSFIAGRLDYEHLNSRQNIIRKPLQAHELATVHGCPLAMGANFGCTRSLWTALEGQDESIDEAEDGDFSVRACRQLGVPAHFVPDAVVHYRLRTGARAYYAQARAYGLGESLLYSRYGDVPLRPRINAAVFRLLSLLGTLARSTTSDPARLSLAWQAGKLAGRARGSARHRVFFL